MRPSCSSPDGLGVFPHGGALAADRSHHGARESACRLQRIVPIRHGRRSRQANASRVITVWMQVPMGAPGDVMNARMPTVFLGHGNPMNALHDNAWTRGWAALGQRLPRPRELLSVQYPAPGDLGLVGRVRELLRPLEVRSDLSWGLDHGTWSVLRHVF